MLYIASIYIIFGLFESIGLYKKNQRRELKLYLLMMAITLVFTILIVINIKLPSPAKMIEYLVNRVIG